MKKIIAMLLVLTLSMGLIACSNNNTADDTTEAVSAAASAVELLTNIWNNVPEDKKFFAMGGDMNNVVDNAPGAYSLEDEGLTATLLIPTEQIANVSEAASLVHAMMLNNFTCGAFKVTGDTKAFADAMKTAIANNPWMCGQPDKYVVAVIGEYVVALFGINDAVDPFVTAMTTAYTQAELVYNEAIAQ